ncbi:hypothetical protein glysoja_003203 [Glycine soja]|nr:hypothetical protein glysoja_003203 [Glycine soja]
MVKKTVLKVDISCLKCKRKLLKIVSSLQGVDKIEADEGKGTLTVTGDADPYEIIVRIRKAGKHAEVVSVGPPRDPPVWHSLGLILIDESVSPIRVGQSVLNLQIHQSVSALPKDKKEILLFSGCTSNYPG